MITVEISVNECIKLGELGVVKQLRQAGIPARRGLDGELRLCQVWSADGERCLGYGKLEWNRSIHHKKVTFYYEPPTESLRDPNVIDVEAHEINEQPKLK